MHQNAYGCRALPGHKAGSGAGKEKGPSMYDVLTPLIRQPDTESLS